ncbi:MAG: FHIPEP family type III secretion protein, partial [Lachnospiraceae bacterium]|nr:FHIPEP family type III secretion protein [Lachnospiraceae bacterium]
MKLNFKALSNYMVGVYVMAVIVFFIVPIPSLLLDVLVAFNMSIAMIVLFNALFAPDVLQMSSFPTILLMTTIFRISLNVSSTRLILAKGDP